MPPEFTDREVTFHGPKEKDVDVGLSMPFRLLVEKASPAG